MEAATAREDLPALLAGLKGAPLSVVLSLLLVSPARVDEVCLMTGFSEQAVRYALRQLEARRLVIRESPGSDRWQPGRGALLAFARDLVARGRRLEVVLMLTEGFTGSRRQAMFSGRSSTWQGRETSQQGDNSLPSTAGIDPQAAWQSLLRAMRYDPQDRGCLPHLEPCQVVGFDDGVMILRAATTREREYLEDRFTSFLSRQLAGIFGQAVGVRFISGEEAGA